MPEVCPMSSLKNNRRLTTSVIFLGCAIAVLVLTFAPQRDVFAADNELAAVFRKGSLEVNIPYDESLARNGSFTLEILDPTNRQVARLARSATSRDSSSWRATLPLERNLKLEDLAWDRLKISSGVESKIVSISEILRVPVVRIFAQRSYAAGSPASIRVIAVDSKSGSPLRNGKLVVELLQDDQSSTLFSGRTDSFGTAQVEFTVPGGSFGSRQLRVTADTSLGEVVATQPIQLERRDRILLTTDKPLYQPGQTIHLRALSFDGPTRTAAGNQPITLEVEDAKGNKVFKKRSRTDRFGVASADFELADEVNFGPYHIRAILGDGDAASSQEKTVTVDRYTLPKFKVAIELGDQREDSAKHEGSYYQPGDTVSGRVLASYLFGKAISNADVTLSLTTFDVQSVELAKVKGKTDKDGRFSFSSKLPDFFAGRSMQQGSAPVSISAEVKDSAQHVETKSRDILVSRTPILIIAIPESGQLLPGLENRVFILTSYPDGTPARTTITGDIPGGRADTDSSGVATVSIRPDNKPVELNLKATDNRGRAAKTTIKLQSQTLSQSLMVRTNKAVYKIGDKLQVETFSTRLRGAVYVDVIKDGQTVVTRAIDTARGRGDLSIDLTPAMFGTIEVRAYQITSDADPIMNRRLIYVDPADDLRVEVSAERDTYMPGEEAAINFRVTDRLGRPVSAALGIEIVDEAVFALSDKHPGFEKVFMNLEKELLTPRYEVHQFSFEEVVNNGFDGEKPAQEAQRELAARVLLAAAGSIRDRDVRREFGREALEAKRAEYANQYAMRLYENAQTVSKALTVYYEQYPAAKEGFGKDLERFASQSASQQRMLQDPWGNILVGEGTLNESGYSNLTLRSPGPDRRPKTGDDITVQIYAQRQQIGKETAPFQGNASVKHGAVAGGRAAIEGVIKDSSANPIARVGVAAQRLSSGRTTWAYSDSNGRFSFANLSPGTYRIRFEAPGFRSTSYRTIALEAGDKGTISAALVSRGITPVILTAYVPMPAGAVFDEVRRGRFDKNQRVFDLAQVANGAVALPKAAPAMTNDKSLAEEPADRDGEGGGGPRVRSFFPETLYTNPSLITDGRGLASIRVPLADSITTWRISALASTMRGALGSSTSPIRVFQDFFVDLDLPGSITEGDALSIPVAVYNYLPDPHRVSLDLRQDPWFQLDGDTAAKQIDVKAGEVTVAYFRIKASKIGEQQLQVTAKLDNAQAGQQGDAIARTIDILPNGEEKAVVINERLEGDTSQEVVIPEGAIPDASKIFVKLYPGALSQVVEGLDSILRMPGGCFEQTSSSTYPNVLVMDYLKTSKKITPEIQAKAEGFISLGYQRLVTFEVPGGGFSWFGQTPANKILTAYGLMEFSDMSQVYEVDPRLIERTQAWLASQQQPDGSFKPDTYFINEGATTRYNTDVERITAYIGWALAVTGYKGEAVEKARQYVSSHSTGKEDAYTLAVIANFAADYQKDRNWTESAINQLASRVTETDKVAYWKQEGETPTSARNDSADLETTALAAQALLKAGQKSGLAKKALDYLTQKKDALGNWQTTQATILSLKAFLLSFTKGTNAETAGDIEISMDGKTVERVQISRDNNDLLHLLDLKAYTHEGSNKVGLKFNGRGSMQYQIVGRYYVPWAKRIDGAREPLSIDVSYDRTRLAQDEIATAKVRVQNNTPATAKMIMIDLGIPPGFEPSPGDFEELVGSTRNKTGGKLEKFTITAKQVILYFDGLSARQRVEFSYRLRAKFPVRAQSFSSRVYEYYNPTVENKTKPVEMTVTAK
jgi:hypothetical protein